MLITWMLLCKSWATKTQVGDIMSWTGYNEAIAEIRESFEADYFTAQEIYRDLREDFGRPVTADDITEEIEEAEAAEDIDFERIVEEGLTDDGETDWEYWEGEYDTDDRYFEDGWMDYGEELEITIQYEEA